MSIPSNGSIDRVSWEIISGVEAIDDLTVTVTFAEPTIGWFQPFGSNLGAIYPRHFWDGKDPGGGECRVCHCRRSAPARSSLNRSLPTTRSSTRRTRTTASRTSRTSSASSSRAAAMRPRRCVAVTSTGEWDIGVHPADRQRQALESSLGDKGQVYGTPGTGVEKIQFNFSDPNTEVDGQRSQKDTPASVPDRSGRARGDCRSRSTASHSPTSCTPAPRVSRRDATSLPAWGSTSRRTRPGSTTRRRRHRCWTMPAGC